MQETQGETLRETGCMMIHVSPSVLIMLLFLLIPVHSMAKEWRGIVPLKSTKSDVEKLLGKRNQDGYYIIKNERVSVWYSKGPCDNRYQALARGNCDCLVAADTVLRVFVTLDSPVSAAKLGLDKTKYQRTSVESYHPTATYADPKEGVVYTIREPDTVTYIDYLPAAKDCAEVINREAATPANVWRGIVPLRSVRADVEQSIGPPKNSNGDVSIYDTGENRVDVSYSADPCTEASPRGVASDVVSSVTVSPRVKRLVESLGLDKTKFRRIENTHPENWIHYINSAEGITVEALINNEREEVLSVVYAPTARDRELRCGKVGTKKTLRNRKRITSLAIQPTSLDATRTKANIGLTFGGAPSR